MKQDNNILAEFFLVPFKLQTYLNLIYLLLAFPLGLIYFVTMITGISVGIGLLIIWIGIPILLIMLAISWAFVAFERKMTIIMLRQKIPPMSRVNRPGLKLWEQFKRHLANPVTWKGLSYLFIKFPLGILSFTIAITLISISVSLIATPIVAYYIPIDMGVYIVDNPVSAIYISIIGIIFGFISMHVLNGLAFVYGGFAKLMLGDSKHIIEQKNPIIKNISIRKKSSKSKAKLKKPTKKKSGTKVTKKKSVKKVAKKKSQSKKTKKSSKNKKK